MSRLPSIAVRNVGRNRRRSVITAITIVFGVAMIIIIRGFTWGMEQVMTDDVVQVRTGAIQVHKTGFVDNVDAVPTRLNMPYDPALVERIKRLANVKGVTGRISFQGLVSNGRAQTMFVGRGVDFLTEKEVCPDAATFVNEGRALTAEDTGQALLGYELAESFGMKPGQQVMLQSTSPSGRSNALDLKIAGLSSSSLPFENKRVVTVPLSVAQSLVGLEGRVTEYALAVNDLSLMEETAEKLRAELGAEYEVHTWKEMQPFLRDIIQREKFILVAISLVLFVVVVTGIINTVLMSVYERVREVGTMLAVGVRRSQVMTMFVIEALVIGLAGGLSGALVGGGVNALLSFIGVPIKMSGVSGVKTLYPVATWQFMAAMVAAALATSVVAAVYPAWKASRLDPVEALRST